MARVAHGQNRRMARPGLCRRLVLGRKDVDFVGRLLVDATPLDQGWPVFTHLSTAISSSTGLSPSPTNEITARYPGWWSSPWKQSWPRSAGAAAWPRLGPGSPATAGLCARLPGPMFPAISASQKPWRVPGRRAQSSVWHLGDWLGRKDSNLRSPDPESGALPLGHTPARPGDSSSPYAGTRSAHTGPGCRSSVTRSPRGRLRLARRGG